MFRGNCNSFFENSTFLSIWRSHGCFGERILMSPVCFYCCPFGRPSQFFCVWLKAYIGKVFLGSLRILGFIEFLNGFLRVFLGALGFLRITLGNVSRTSISGDCRTEWVIILVPYRKERSQFLFVPNSTSVIESCYLYIHPSGISKFCFDFHTIWYSYWERMVLPLDFFLLKILNHGLFSRMKIIALRPNLEPASPAT